MGRVSLTEDYDDRSVIAKLNEMDKRVTENTTVVTAAEASAKASADAAQQTADRFAGSVGAVVQNANTQINASKAQVDQAKAEVDETVTTVAQAVQTANNASASAQQSANTVATYDTRLIAVEDESASNTSNIIDLQDRMGVAESKNTQQDTAITALQTADTNNVKINVAQDITGRKTIVETYPRLDFKSTSATDIGSGLRLLDTADGSQKHYLYMYPNRIDIPTPSADAPSSATVNKKYVESTDGATNNLVHRTANESINGYKQFEYTPSIKKIYVNNNNLTTKWVRLCYYKENNNYEDMHMITRFISGHTTDADFMFTVDIKQRSSHKGRTLVLLDNASTIPLCINKAPVMGQNNCGLVALWIPNGDITNIEIWGKLPSNRLCITVQNYVNIMNMPTTEGVYMDSNTVGFDIATSFVTWDCNTYSDTLPSNATKTQYIQKGKEDVA